MTTVYPQGLDLASFDNSSLEEMYHAIREERRRRVPEEALFDVVIVFSTKRIVLPRQSGKMLVRDLKQKVADKRFKEDGVEFNGPSVDTPYTDIDGILVGDDDKIALYAKADILSIYFYVQ